jgi:hypothetical protein
MAIERKESGRDGRRYVLGKIDGKYKVWKDWSCSGRKAGIL